jgi:hypothetical protein
MAWRPGLSVALAIALGAGSASAQTATAASAEPERYSLSWVRGEGAETCPARAELTREVTKRLGRAPFDEQAARSIEIQVSHGPRGFETLTRVRDATGAIVGRRELSSEEANCEPIFSATVLAVALLIDPDAALPNEATAQSVESFAPSPPVVPAPAPEMMSKEVSTPEIVATREAPLDEGPPPPRAVTQSPAGVGFEGVVAAGLLPDPGPGASLFVTYRPGSRFGLLASALYLESSTASQGAAVFDVGLTAFGVAGTFDFIPESSLRWTAEAGPMVGALHVSVRSPTPIDPGDFAFVGVTGGSRLQVPLGSLVFVSFRGAAVLNLVRRGLFVKGQEDAVFREPVLGGLFSAGLGLSIF